MIEQKITYIKFIRGDIVLTYNSLNYNILNGSRKLIPISMYYSVINDLNFIQQNRSNIINKSIQLYDQESNPIIIDSYLGLGIENNELIEDGVLINRNNQIDLIPLSSIGGSGANPIIVPLINITNSVVPHTFGRLPSVQVYDIFGNEAVLDIVVTENNVTINSNQLFSGSIVIM